MFVIVFKVYLVEPNPDYALEFYIKAKKENYPRALNNLGNFYLKLSDDQSVNTLYF